MSATMLTRQVEAPVAARTIGLTKTYGAGGSAVRALDGVELLIERGRFTAVMGPSGSGKSTLLHCLAGLDRPDRGVVEIDGFDITQLDERALTRLRRDRFGFVFQSFNLVPSLTAGENITLPLQLAGRAADGPWLERLVQALDLGSRLSHRPAELSGGQQQRVAVARALVTRPAVVFADEPTGALDSRHGRELLALLRMAVDEFEQTVVMVTHDPAAAAMADEVVFLSDGRLVDHLLQPTVSAVLERMGALDPHDVEEG